MTLPSQAGKVGRQLSMQVDLVRSIGPLTAWRWKELLAPKAPVRPPGRERLYRELWQRAGEALAATCTELPGGFLEFTKEGRSTIVWSNLVPLDDPVTLKLAGNKPMAHALLERSGVPMMPQLASSWRAIESAQTFLRQHGVVVVKPATSTGRGTGVTCGVRTDAALRRALRRASGWDTEVVLERQAVGTEYRLLVLDGETIASIKRNPPSVVGDGRNTVAALIANENHRRAQAAGALGLWPIRVDLDCLLTLERSGLSLQSVLGDGRAVPVKSAVNENAAEDNETVDPVPAPLAALGRRAARALGARLLSVEVITQDAQEDLATSDVQVIEVNTTPGILCHVQVANPSTAAPVAELVLATLLQEGQSEALRTGP